MTVSVSRAAAALALSACVLAACSTTSGTPDTGSAAGGTYTIWDPYPQFDDSADWVKLLQKCGTDAGVTVKRTAYDTSDLTNKALLAAQQGNSPDVLIVDNPVVSTLADAGVLTTTEEMKVDTAAVEPNLLAAGQIGGKTYGIPIGANTLALYYNKAVLAAAGVDPAAVKDWASLTAALGKVKATGKKGITFSAIGTEEGSSSCPGSGAPARTSPSSTRPRASPPCNCGRTGSRTATRPTRSSATRRRRAGRSSPPASSRSPRTARGSWATRRRPASSTASSPSPRRPAAPRPPRRAASS
nr:hypothetical protein GCM10020063_033780 [Dactylosporangium thailandense]